MEKNEIELYRKKKKLYDKLGASKFQEVVFAVERLKYKFMKKFMPNFIEHYDKRVEKQQRIKLKKAKTEEERRKINKTANYSKLRTHREINREENRNYHMNKADATEIYGYLEWNKRIHKKGLINNAIFGTIWTTAIFIAPSVATPYLIALLAIEGIKAIVNFECVNLQNYNMCRYKLIEDKITQRELKRVKSEINDYGEAAKIVHEKIVTEAKLPSMTEMIDSMETTDQLEQFKNILLREKARREEEKQKVLSKSNKTAQKNV